MGFKPQCQAPQEVMEPVGYPLNPQCFFFFLIGNHRNIINEKSKEKYKFMMMTNRKRKKKSGSYSKKS